MSISYFQKVKESRVLRWGLFAFFLFVVFSIYNYFMCDFIINSIYVELRSIFTFLMLGWGSLMWLYKNETVEITLTEGKFKNKNETFSIKRKKLQSISDLTNLVSAKYYGGDKIEGSVRNQLFMYQGLITEEEMRKINQ